MTRHRRVVLLVAAAAVVGALILLLVTKPWKQAAHNAERGQDDRSGSAATPALPASGVASAADSLPSPVDRSLDPNNPALLVEVQDFYGGPIAGARILDDDVLLGRTDATGFARVDIRPRGFLEREGVVVRAQGYAQDSFTRRRYGHVLVKLMPESEIFGRVTKQSDGSPIEGAIVDKRAVTDADGRFHLGGLRAANHVFYVASPEGAGRSESMYIGVGVRKEVNIAVGPAASISGRVVGAGDTLPAGVTVIARMSGDNYVNKEVPIGDDGRFEITSLEPGTYNLVALLRPDRGVISERLSVEAKGAVTDVEVPLHQSALLVCSVRDRSGQPVVGMEMIGEYTVESMGRRGPRSSGRRRYCTTGSEGRCTLFIKDEGVIAVRPRFYSSAAASSAELPEADGKVLEFTVDSPGKLLFKVADGSGKATPGLPVRVDRSGDLVAFCYVDAEGRCLVEGLGAGPVDITVTVAGSWFASRGDDPLAKTTAVVVPGAVTEVALQVPTRAGTIVGRVVEASGAPVREAMVSYRRDRNTRQRGARRTFGDEVAMTGADGTFRFDGLVADATYRVWAHAGERTAVAQDVTPSADRIELSLIERNRVVVHPSKAGVTQRVVLMRDQAEVHEGFALRWPGRKPRAAHFDDIATGAWTVVIYGDRRGKRKELFRKEIVVEPGGEVVVEPPE